MRNLAKEKRFLDWLGFKSLLAWHYIILFAPLLVNLDESNLASFVFERQFVLYGTLAVCFGILMLVGRRLMHFMDSRSPIIPLVAIGLLSMLATSFAVIAAVRSDLSLVWQLLAVMLLGASEALLMYLYLHFNALRTVERSRRALALDMIYGALFAFFTCCLQTPFSFIVAILMPGFAVVSLLVNWSAVHRLQQEPPVEPTRKEHGLQKGFFKTLLPAFVYATAFGLMQGSLMQGEVMLLMASNPLSLLGITISGLVLFLRKDSGRMQSDVESLHRLSLLLLVLGVLGLTFFNVISQFVISEAAILAGFNLFDFGTLALTIYLTRQFGPQTSLYIDGGRCLLYASFALGLISGFFGTAVISDLAVGGMPYLIGGIAIALLVITLLFKAEPDEHGGRGFVFEGGAQIDDGFVGETDSDASQQSNSMGRWKTAINQVAAAYQLSPREVEVFLLLAKGRNAEYIQRNLVISLHTAKTHIANIYRKLEVHSTQEMLDIIESFGEHTD
jgi:DNA-binding CsgD family transcriptional regulator